MGDKDLDELFGNPEIYIKEPDGEITLCGEPINSMGFKAEGEAIRVPAKSDFSLSFDVSSLSNEFKDLLELKPVKEARDMLDRLRNYQALWRKYYGFGMRKERRKIEREFNALAQRLALHCKMYNITIGPVKRNEHH